MSRMGGGGGGGGGGEVAVTIDKCIKKRVTFSGIDVTAAIAWHRTMRQCSAFQEWECT